ncbi:hypothetical protein R3I93_016900 [Phoxinus phoxinus]|uniref:Immunoglobulin domain-containing protein n=1 Tax=Phoxinus phoxinus TaxID=58324 RepID=A0AAN9GYB4_9TELE
MSLLVNLLSVILISTDHGASSVGSDEVSLSVMEGDSVTLHTGVQTNRQQDIRWYYNGIRIAKIIGDLTKTCTDVQCNEGNERFRDRLKLDHQTGSLSIMNTRNTHSGEYTLNIFSNSSNSEKIFSINVQGVSAAERDEVKKNEGESVTFDPAVARTPNDVMTWYFNDIHIAEITGDQSKICTDVQCNKGTERFRDRLKLDHQTVSLTITNTRNTDSGLYKLQINSINSSSFSISRVKRFSLNVIDIPDSGLSSEAVAGIVVVVLLVAVAVAFAVIYYRQHKSHNDRAPVPQSENDADNNPPHDPNDIPLEDTEEN